MRNRTFTFSGNFQTNNDGRSIKNRSGLKFIRWGLCLLIIGSSSSVQAQPFDLDWVFEIDGGSSGSDDFYDMVTDTAGNIYVTGMFNGTPDFDPGPGYYPLFTPGTNTFVAKYTNDSQLLWAYRFAGTTNKGLFISLDSLNNIYVTGHFSGTVDFDTGPSTYNLTAVGQTDVYVCKLTNDGSFLWTKTLGGPQDDLVADSFVTPGGKIYHTGYFQSTADLDPGVGTQNVTSFGGLDIYIQVLETDGNLDWAHQIGGGEWDYGDEIIADSLGNVYVGCRYWWPVDFDPGPGTAVVGSTYYASCLVKYNSNGDFVWVKTLGMSTDIDDLCLDSSHQLVISGSFSDTTDFDLGAGTYTLINEENSDQYFGKYTTDGDFIWMRSFGGIGTVSSRKMYVDSNDRIYFCGTFSSETEFDPGTDTFLLDANTGSDAFLLMLEDNGDFMYCTQIGNNGGPVSFRSILTDPDMNIIGCGYFAFDTDFDPGGAIYTVSGSTPQDGFVIKFGPCTTPPDPLGDINPDHINICFGESTTLYPSHLGALSWYSQLTGGSFIATDNSFTTPNLYNTITYYVQDSTCTNSLNRTPVTVTVNDLPDIIINANPGPDICADEILTLSGSGGLTYTWNNSVTDGVAFMPIDSTTYIVTGTDINGCINTDTLLVTVHDPVISFIHVNGFSLEALTFGDTYQWYDCLAGFTPIAGQNGTSFTPIENGYYALEVTIDGCADMSSCYQIFGLSAEDATLQPFSVYPNPTAGIIYIDTNLPGSIEIFDAAGRRVFYELQSFTDMNIDMSSWNSGFYTLRFTSSNSQFNIKIFRL